MAPGIPQDEKPRYYTGASGGEGSADEAAETAPPGVEDYPEGGTRAWLVAAGAAGVLFSTMGYANSFGIFESYYLSHQLRHETADRVAWIGSLQSFLMFAAGSVGGPLLDRYGTFIIRPAAVVYLFAVMMTSLCQQYWHFMLAQGLLTGVANGLLIFPAMAAVSQFFEKRRGAALGVVIAGSSIGALVFPIILSKMLNSSSLGFGWSVRISGFVMIPVMIVSVLVIKTRLPPRTTNFVVWGAFKVPCFDILIFATFCMYMGIFTPLFYLPTYATEHGMSTELASYMIAILNGASIFGRIIPGILADKFGRLNMLATAALSTGIILLCWTRVDSTAGLVVYAVMFGFCSGAIISGSSSAFAVCCKDPREIGTYMGMGIAVASISALIGPPVNGALLNKYQGFEQVSILSGVMCLAGGVFTFGSKAATPKGVLGNV